MGDLGGRPRHRIRRHTAGTFVGFRMKMPKRGQRSNQISGDEDFFFIHKNLLDGGRNPKFTFKLKDGLIFTVPYQ